MSLTPHGPGFSFLDALDVLEPGQRARGRKWLDPAAPFFADHFPGNPLMPGVLLIECAAQAAGALWQQPQAFLAAVQQFRFLKAVLPGQTVEIEVALEKDFGALAQFDVILSVAGRAVAQGKLTMSRSA
jgi:3-hydroxyacyl-[acyl-carrier-protein] dehydratase